MCLHFAEFIIDNKFKVEVTFTMSVESQILQQICVCVFFSDSTDLEYVLVHTRSGMMVIYLQDALIPT